MSPNNDKICVVNGNDICVWNVRLTKYQPIKNKKINIFDEVIDYVFRKPPGEQENEIVLKGHRGKIINFEYLSNDEIMTMSEDKTMRIFSICLEKCVSVVEWEPKLILMNVSRYVEIEFLMHLMNRENLMLG